MTKVIEISEKIRICKEKKQTGDYQTLAKILNTTVDGARARFYREEERAVNILYHIIEQRENLIQKYQNQ